ncbi:hypothetical protein ACJ7VZ_19920 [Aeromonas salmonicida]|uniref:hypothetical protein n=1 Tax=Aeromonas salmonicida TaxID=645 RepID=UPI0038BA61A6
MKKITAPDHITWFSRVITDLINPTNDLIKNNKLEDMPTKRRIVKNTVCYALGIKSGSNLENILKFTSQRPDNGNFYLYLQDNLDIIMKALVTRFGSSIPEIKVFEKKEILLKGIYHPSGRLYLDYRHRNGGIYTPIDGVFFGNFEPREFYEATFRLYHFLRATGYSVEFENMTKLERLDSVLVELDIDARMNLRSWIYNYFDKSIDEDIRVEIDGKIKNSFERMGLQYQTKHFGDFGLTPMPMSLNTEGVLIPAIYFTHGSLREHKLYPYR